MALLSKYTVTQRLKDTSGASIVIALVFFLICAVVGSVVLTAASINAKAVATHRDTQQAEYTVSSAAQLMADQLTSISASISWSKFTAGGIPEEMTVPVETKELMRQIWKGSTAKGDQFKKIWEARSLGESFHLGGESEYLTIDISNADKITPVYAWVSIDRYFNISVDLSTDPTRANAAAYKETVKVSSVPTYNSEGQMTSCGWPEAVIVKTKQETTKAGGV